MSGRFDVIDDRAPEVGTPLAQQFHPIGDRLPLVGGEGVPPPGELVRDLDLPDPSSIATLIMSQDS
jgi:hypothetical protein